MSFLNIHLVIKLEFSLKFNNRHTTKIKLDTISCYQFDCTATLNFKLKNNDKNHFDLFIL